MTQIIEFSLPTENYLEYVRLLREHGIVGGGAYARLVTSENYYNPKPLACARTRRAKR